MEILGKKELEKKIGKKGLFADDNNLAVKLIYENGINGFDTLLNGKSLNEFGAVIHIKKYPKGICIAIAKQFKQYPIGIPFSEIKNINIIKNKFLIQLDNGESISFLFKEKDLIEIKEFINNHMMKNLSASSQNQVNQVVKKKEDQGGKLPKGIIITCWVIIGLWLIVKFVGIANGYLLDELDFTNPSLLGIIAWVCIVFLVISTFSKKKEG